MTIEEAKKLIKAQNMSSEKASFIEGLQLFEKYKPKFWETDIVVEHDIIYLPGFNEDMSVDEILFLSRCGFFIDSEFDCWAMFT